MRNHQTGRGGGSHLTVMGPMNLERSGVVRMLEVLREKPANGFVGQDGQVGIGIRFRPTDQNCYIVAGLTAGGPAEEAGILEGDIIHAVDGVMARGMSTDELIRKIAGAPGTIVTLSLEASRTASSETRRSSQNSAISSAKDGNISSLPSPRKYELTVTRRENLLKYTQGPAAFDLGFRFVRTQDGSTVLDSAIDGTPASELIKRGKVALGHALLCIDQQVISAFDLNSIYSWLQGPPGTSVVLTMEATGNYTVTTSDVQELNRSLYSSREGSVYAASWPSSRHSSPERTHHMAGRPCVKVCVVDAAGLPRAADPARRYFCCVSVVALRALEAGKATAELMGDSKQLARALAHAGRSGDVEGGTGAGAQRSVRPHRRTKGVQGAGGVEWERLFSFYEASAVSVFGGRVVSGAEEAEEAEELRGQPVQLLVSVHEQVRGGRGKCLGHAVLGLYMGGIEDRRLLLQRGGEGEDAGVVSVHVSCTYGVEEGAVRRASFFQEMVVLRQRTEAGEAGSDEEQPGWPSPVNARFDALAAAHPATLTASPPPVAQPSAGLLQGRQVAGSARATAEVGLLSGKEWRAAGGGVEGQLTDIGDGGVGARRGAEDSGRRASGRGTEGAGFGEARRGGGGAREGMVDRARFPYGMEEQVREALQGRAKEKREERPGRRQGRERDEEEGERHGWRVEEEVGELERVAGRVEEAVRRADSRQGEQWMLRAHVEALQRRAASEARQLDHALQRVRELEGELSRQGGSRRVSRSRLGEEVAGEGLSERSLRLSGQLQESEAEATDLRLQLQHMEEALEGSSRGQRGSALEMRSQLRVERDNNGFLAESLRELSLRHAQHSEELLAALSHKDAQVAALSRAMLEREEEVRQAKVELRRMRAAEAAVPARPPVLPAVDEASERPRPAAPAVLLRDGHWEEVWEPDIAEQPPASPPPGRTPASSPSVHRSPPPRVLSQRPDRRSLPSPATPAEIVHGVLGGEGGAVTPQRKGERGGAAAVRSKGLEAHRPHAPRSPARRPASAAAPGRAREGESKRGGGEEREGRGRALASAEERSEALRKELLAAIDGAEGILTSLPFSP